jgi:DNA transposition AAA+ family ATPase
METPLQTTCRRISSPPSPSLAVSIPPTCSEPPGANRATKNRRYPRHNPNPMKEENKTPPADSKALVPAADLTPEVHGGNTTRASWPISAADLRANLSHCSEEGREAVVRGFMWCIDPQHPVRKSEFAREVGYDENTIYKIITGRYRGPDNKMLDVPEKLIKGIEAFMARERDRFLGKKQEFVQTPLAKRVFTTCDLVRESRSMGMIWGPSHCGKSWALEHYQQANNHGRTIYARLGAASGLGGMLKVMSIAAGNSDRANTADMIDRLNRALAPGMLFILDEVHQLAYTYRKESFFSCIEVVREIHDRTKCGIVLCGTNLMLGDLESARKAELEQVWKRGVHQLDLANHPSKADVAAILAHAGLEMPKRNLEVKVQAEGGSVISEKPFSILQQLAKNDGLLSITERLRYGRKLAQKDGKRLSWHSFVLAHLLIEKGRTQQEDDWGKDEQ